MHPKSIASLCQASPLTSHRARPSSKRMISQDRCHLRLARQYEWSKSLFEGVHTYIYRQKIRSGLRKADKELPRYESLAAWMPEWSRGQVQVLIGFSLPGFEPQSMHFLLSSTCCSVALLKLTAFAIHYTHSISMDWFRLLITSGHVHDRTARRGTARHGTAHFESSLGSMLQHLGLYFVCTSSVLIVSIRKQAESAQHSRIVDMRTYDRAVQGHLFNLVGPYSIQ